MSSHALSLYHHSHQLFSYLLCFNSTRNCFTWTWPSGSPQTRIFWPHGLTRKEFLSYHHWVLDWEIPTCTNRKSYDQCLQQKVREDAFPKLLSVHNTNFSWWMLPYHPSTSTVKVDSLKCTGVCTHELQGGDIMPEAFTVHIHKCIQNCFFSSLESQNY